MLYPLREYIEGKYSIGKRFKACKYYNHNYFSVGVIKDFFDKSANVNSMKGQVYIYKFILHCRSKKYIENKIAIIELCAALREVNYFLYLFITFTCTCIAKLKFNNWQDFIIFM